MQAMKIIKAVHGIALAFAFLGAGQAFAADEAVLAQKSGCLACHQGVKKSNGPPFKEVAAKYAGQKNAEDILVEHILKGTGPAGQGWMKAGKATLPFMPPNGNITRQDARNLTKWVLATTGEIPDISGFFVTDSISITGAVENKLTLNVAELRNFPPQLVGETPITCQTGADKGKLENIKGVLLKDILEKAVVISKEHNDVKKMAIIATASDGYKVIFSWSEVFNSSVGEGVIVFFEKNKLPLADNEGRIAMISTKDIRTGPRHVKWLQAIEVRKIVE